jgi:hypothetical protein
MNNEPTITVMIHSNGNFVACIVYPEQGKPFSDWRFENSKRTYKRYITAENDAVRWAKRTNYKLILAGSPVGMNRNYMMHQDNRLRVWKRRSQEPNKPVKLEDLVARLKSELDLYGEELCTISGSIILHTNYSHVVDVVLNLGADQRNNAYFKCPHCNCMARHIVGHMIDTEKFWCPNCGRHTEEGYDDSVEG